MFGTSSSRLVFSMLSRLGLLALIPLMLTGCSSKPRNLAQWTGSTMGTRFLVISGDGPVSEEQHAAIRKAIDHRLRELNKQMSTWERSSEISKFNKSSSVRKEFPVSTDFAKVVDQSRKVSSQSAGAFDPTVGPLVRLWGFGPGGKKNSSRQKKSSDSKNSKNSKNDKKKKPKTPAPTDDALPTKSEIQRTLGHVGWKKLEVSINPPYLKKLDRDVELDLSAIAKGYAVDQVGNVLEQNGIKNYLVEIGGEIVVKGQNVGKPWTVGIEAPDTTMKGRPAQAGAEILEITDKAVATSGSYRNFTTINGKHYQHTIDPHTGYPVDHHVARVTVIADNCMLADALATAVMVAGPRDGLALLDRYRDENVEGLIIELDPSTKRTKRHPTRGFDNYLRQSSERRPKPNTWAGGR